MHSARPCLWWAYCYNIAGLRICPLHWVLGQIYLPFTHSSGHILFSPFLNHILTHMESALKAPVNFWSRLCFTTPSSLEEALAHSRVVTRSAWMAHPDLAPPGDVAISWSPHSPFWILFAFHSLFTSFVFSHLEEKHWPSSGAWAFTTQADEALSWKRISPSFQASVLSFKAILCLEPDKTACQQIPGQNVKVIGISKALTW